LNQNQNKSLNQNLYSNRIATEAFHPIVPNLRHPKLELNSSTQRKKNQKKPKNLLNKKNLPTKKKEKQHILRKSHDKTKNQPTRKDQ
jgi:hypothetical protein